LLGQVEGMIYERDVANGDACRHGLTGRYFNNLGLSGSPQVSRIDSNVDFNWDMASPVPGIIDTEDFSVSWTGRIVPPVTGTYQFCTTSDDGARLWVDDMATPVIDNWVDQAVTSSCGTVDLVANEPVPIRLDFYDTLEEAVIRLSWSYPGQTDVPVSSSALYAQ
jgi:beta-glucosidase